MCLPMPLGPMKRLKNCERCQICEAPLLSCIFSMSKLDLIRGKPLREGFVFISIDGRQRQRPLAGICKSLLYCSTQKHQASHLTRSHWIRHRVFCALQSEHYQQVPTKAILCYVRTGYFPLPDGLRHFFFFFGCRHRSYRPLLHKHVDKWFFVNFVAGDIYSVTKQLLEPALWACFPFSLVIICLHASGPWAASPPMTGGSMKELIYNCN